MYQRVLSNKDLFGSAVLFLMAASLFADMALPGARQTYEISVHDRLLCHLIQMSILGIMCVFVCCNYTLPRIRAVMLWELSLAIFLSLSACHAAFITSREQLTTLSKFVFWPIGYFFFRILADDVKGYTKKLSGLIVCFFIFAMWSYVSQIELRAEIAERAGSASSNTGWKLLAIFAISLCLVIAGDRRGRHIATVALLFAPLSLKRGAILAEVVLCMSLLLTSHRLGSLRNFIRTKGQWIIGVVLVWLLVCIDQLELAVKRFSGSVNDGGSGRSEFYPLLLNRWKDADVFNWLFGFGFWSVPEYLDRVWIDRIYAHSDVLELLHDYGLVGILSYLMILAGLFALCRYTWRRRDEGLLIAASIASLFLVAALVAGNVMFRETVYLMIPLGYLTGRLEKANATMTIYSDDMNVIDSDVRIAGLT